MNCPSFDVLQALRLFPVLCVKYVLASVVVVLLKKQNTCPLLRIEKTCPLLRIVKNVPVYKNCQLFLKFLPKQNKHVGFYQRVFYVGVKMI